MNLFIFHVEEKKYHLKEKVFKSIYWLDYTSAIDLINNIKPYKILFQDINSLEALSLNIAAQNKKIETYIVEHGMAGKLRMSIARDNLDFWKKKDVNIKNDLSKDKFLSLLFLFRSFNLLRIILLVNVLKFIYFIRKYGLFIGVEKLKFKERLPNKYINFTKHNAKYVIERDKLNEKDIIEVGNPYFDEFMKKKNFNNSKNE